MNFTYESYRRELRKDAELMKDAVAVIRKTVKLHGPRAVQEEISGMTRAPVDRGTYRRSFKFEDIPGGAIAYNFAPYASVIEYGRRPGAKMPPVDLLVDWVRRKGIGLQRGPIGVRETKRGPGSFRRGPGKGAQGPTQVIRRGGPRQLVKVGVRDKLRANQLRGIAFTIARAIKARGLPALKILEHASERIDAEVRVAIDEFLNERR